MIQVFYLGSGSRIWILTFYLSWILILILNPRSLIQGSGTGFLIPDPGQIRNTEDFGLAQAVGGFVGYWLSTANAVLINHSMDQLLEAYMCKKGNSLYILFTHNGILCIFYLHIISQIFTVFKL